MTNILRQQLFRLKKSKLFFVMIFVTVGLQIIGALLELLLVNLTGIDADLDAMLQMLKQQGLLYSSLATTIQTGETSLLLSLLCSAIFLSKEFSGGTIRNAVLSYKTKKQIFFSYYLIALIVGACIYIANYATCFACYASIFGFAPLGVADAISACLCTFALGILCVIFVQSCVCMFLFVGQKQSTAILFPLLICVVLPGVVSGIVTAVVTARYGLESALLPTLPWQKWVPFVNKSMLVPTQLDATLVGIIALYDVVFSALFVAVGYASFERADLK